MLDKKLHRHENYTCDICQTGHNLLVAYCEHYSRFTHFWKYEERTYNVIMVKSTTHTTKSIYDTVNKCVG